MPTQELSSITEWVIQSHFFYYYYYSTNTPGQCTSHVYKHHDFISHGSRLTANQQQQQKKQGIFRETEEKNLTKSLSFYVNLVILLKSTQTRRVSFHIILIEMTETKLFIYFTGVNDYILYCK